LPLGLGLALWQGASACNSPAVDKVFTRHAPVVDDAIELLARDAGAAEQHLTDYLGIARCSSGSINTSAVLAERAQASFDLGLALFRIGERFGGRFGDDPGQAGDDASKLAKRSEEVACALSVVQQLVARPSVPIELRAQAYYLLGNLEFLRHEYDAAVKGYDQALTIVPGDDAPSALAVGRDAAHNRACALRLREENKPPPQNPDAGPKDEPGDGGKPPDEPPPASDGGNKQREKPDDSQQKDQKDQKKPNEDESDPEAKDDQKQPDEPSPDDAKQDQETTPDQKSTPPPPQNLSLSQDDKMLDQLERAPTVQQEAARAQRGRVRRAVEDK
jgi:tetratricopeptide (TPR) repeat protein